MKKHIVIDGNAFYEVDEECLQKMKIDEQKKEEQGREKSGGHFQTRQKNRIS